jgi:hypothetical protein
MDRVTTNIGKARNALNENDITGNGLSPIHSSVHQILDLSLVSED